MISVNDLRNGTFVLLEGRPFQIQNYSHIKMGRGGAIIKAKLKDLHSGALLERSFKNSENIEEITVERKKAQYLYFDDQAAYFMDPESFEQDKISLKSIAAAKKFLKDGMIVQILKYEDSILNVELPIKEVYQVVATPPGVRGDTVSGGSKPATIETGTIVNVPLFIKVGDQIRVNTLEGVYVERA